MDISYELIVAAKLIVSFLIGGFVGYEREKHGIDAGIRTYAAVSVGATLFTSVAAHLTDTAAASRIIANIVVGVGFLGAGIISHRRSPDGPSGLTTAATVWCTAALGVAVGLNMYIIAATGTLLLHFLLSIHHYHWYVRWKNKIAMKHNEHGKDNK